MVYKEFLSRIQLFKNRSFTYFSLSGLCAVIGQGLVYINTTWYAYEYFQSIRGVTLIMFCTWAPTIFLGPLLGVYVDRYNKKSLMILSNMARGIAICIFTLLELFNLSNNIFVLAIVLGIFGSFYMPAAIAYMSSIMEKKDLPKANATVDMIYEVGFMLGMGISGVLIYYLGSVWTLFCAGILFLLSGYFNMLMEDKHNIKTNSSDTSSLSFIQEFIDSIKYVFNKNGLITIYLIQIFIIILLMTIPILLVPYVDKVLNKDTKVFALFEAIYSLGIFIGCFFSPILCEKITFKKTIALLLFIMFLSLLLIAVNYSLVFDLFAYFIVGFCLSSWALSIAQGQIHTHIDYQGRIQSTFNSLSGIGISALYLLVTFKGNLINIQMLYVVEALIALMGFFMIIFTKKDNPCILNVKH